MIKLDNTYKKKSDAIALIKESEAEFDRQINEIALDTCADRSLRCVTLAGPTCSGKTTTASKLTAAMEKAGRRARVVTIDDFYFEENEMKERGLTDIEGPTALNIPLFERAAADLAAGRPTLLPTFDFTDRTRAAFTEYTPTPDDIYIFEGIQAIYPEITSVLKKFSYRSIFIYPATDIEIAGVRFEKNEIRLIRRVVRDMNHRSTSPVETMGLWSAVRQNEETNIFPLVGHENYVINSTVAYELLLMGKYFLEVTEAYPVDAQYAGTVYSLRERLRMISDTAVGIDLVPLTSVMREFAD